MMRTTAIAALLAATPALALAQDAQETGQMDSQSGRISADAMENMVRASDITDAEVYTFEAEDGVWEDNAYWDGVGADWEQIGNVTDIAMSPDGEVTGVIVETGGFLDIGDDHVVLSLGDDVKFASVDDDAEYAFVTAMTEDDLEELPEVEEAWW